MVRVLPAPKLVPSPVPSPPVAGLFPNRLPAAGFVPKPQPTNKWSELIGAVAMVTFRYTSNIFFLAVLSTKTSLTKGRGVGSGSQRKSRLVAKESSAGAEGGSASGGGAEPGRFITE